MKPRRLTWELKGLDIWWPSNGGARARSCQTTNGSTSDSVGESSCDNGICHPALASTRPRPQDEQVASRVDQAPTHLDDVSKAIIEQLQRDGRMPYAAIGKAVGLSEAAVRQRVQRLLDNGVMQIVAVTDPLQLGFARQAMIGIHAEGDVEPIAESLSQMSEIDYVIITAGSFDLMVEVVCESDDHLLELLSKRIRAVDGVRSTESFVYLKLHKQTYSWGVR
ncbi:MAG: Lrp/AsnC family transcriptional regulator [Nocardioidaceae bacterium]|nr:Lrp/AsnC family transcriptional regulator [Nocardioidaceae bacterium]